MPKDLTSCVELNLARTITPIAYANLCLVGSAKTVSLVLGPHKHGAFPTPHYGGLIYIHTYIG